MRHGGAGYFFLRAIIYSSKKESFTISTAKEPIDNEESVD